MPKPDSPLLFRDKYPAAWTFHVNTVRWPFNTLEPEEIPWADPPFKEYAGVPTIVLPGAGAALLPLDVAIRKRLSCRNFAQASLALVDLSTILALAYGIQGVAQLGSKEHLERPVPSGGGLYPLELYLIARDVQDLASGVYHYEPLTHAVKQLKIVSLSRAFVSQLFMNQPYLADAGAILLMTAVADRSMHKYGDRGYRYILLEAGHVAQNVCLAAASLDLGALPLGGFFDGYLAELLGIEYEQELLLYCIAIGLPATSDRVEMRNLSVLLDG